MVEYTGDSGPRQRSGPARALRTGPEWLDADVLLELNDLGKLVDVEAGTANQRADIQAVNITAEGFELQFSTWGDTRVARVRASWMAIGPLRHADDWDLD